MVWVSKPGGCDTAAPLLKKRLLPPPITPKPLPLDDPFKELEKETSRRGVPMGSRDILPSGSRSMSGVEPPRPESVGASLSVLPLVSRQVWMVFDERKALLSVAQVEVKRRVSCEVPCKKIYARHRERSACA